MKLQLYVKIESKEDEVAAICKEYGIRNWSINKDNGLVDVNGYVKITERGLTKLPLNFGKVSAFFNCSYNQLTSLEGCPYEVGDDFWCYRNKLRTLKGSPNVVGGGFHCDSNYLVSLKGCPSKVNGDFYCGNNALISLEGLISADDFFAPKNPITCLDDIGQTMIDDNVSFLVSVMFHSDKINNEELALII